MINLSVKTVAVFVMALCIAIFIWIMFSNPAATNLEKALMIMPVEQDVQQRRWNVFEFDQIIFEDSLLNPFWITTNSSGEIYVADNADLRIKKFNFKGKYIETIGKGRGRGPGEFMVFNSMYTDLDDNIWVTDQINARTTIFYGDGDFETFHIDDIPMRVLPLENNSYVSTYRFSSGISIKSQVESIEHAIPPVVDDEKLWAYVLASEITKDNQGGFVRTFFYTNDFARYTETGKLLYSRKTIHAPSYKELWILPPQRYEDDQQVWFNEVHPESTARRIAGVQVVDTEIHTLVTEFRDGWFRDVIDVYDLENGDYSFSYKLPESLYVVSISDSVLIGIRQETTELTGWNIRATN